jgi:hypothetical protein
MLFRCVSCPDSFCEDHLPKEDMQVLDHYRWFEKLQYFPNNNCMLVCCSAQCQKALRDEHEWLDRQKALEEEGSPWKQLDKTSRQSLRPLVGSNTCGVVSLGLQSKFRKQIERELDSNAPLLQDLCRMLYGQTSDPKEVVQKLFNWKGVGPNPSREELARAFLRLGDELQFYTAPSLRRLGEILGIDVKAIQRQQTEEKKTKQKSGKRGKSVGRKTAFDASQPLVDAIALFLTSPPFNSSSSLHQAAYSSVYDGSAEVTAG